MNLDTQAARHQMVAQQIRTWNVLDERVLQALGSVAREQFVPSAYRNLAFADINMPLAHGQVMLAPNLTGKLLQALAIQPLEQVLIIGDGSGYLAACTAQLAGKVRVVEFHADLAEQAQRNVQQANCNNVSVECGDGLQLNLDNAYDVIIVTGSLPMYDERLQRGLKVGGRLFVVVGTSAPMEALRITRASDNLWQHDSLFETDLPALPNAPQPSLFKF